MKIVPKAIEAACKAFQKAWSAKEPSGEEARWPDDYDADELCECLRCMTAAIEAAAPFIRESVVEECAKVAESYGDKVTGFSIAAQKGAEGASRIIASRIRALDPAAPLSPAAQLAKEMREGTAVFVSARNKFVSAPPSDDPPELGVYPNDGPFEGKEPRR